MKTKSGPTLIFCIAMDVAGCATLLFPAVSEWFDIIWAPLSAYIFLKTFGGKTGKIGSFINLAEEILPFTDVIPTFTLGYIYNRILKRNE